MWSFRKKTEAEKHALRLLKFNRGAVQEYSDYLSRPWRILWTNFIAGMARGLGLIIGAGLLLTVVTFILSRILSQIPVIGEFFTAINVWIQETIGKAE